MNGSAFGTSIDIEGTWAIVGAPVNAYSAGNAYIFQQSGGSWNLQAKLTAAGLAPGARFGDDVAIIASNAVVGVLGRDGPLPGAGAVYAYRNLGGVWTFSQTLTHTTPETDGQFGDSVDIGPGYLAVGAPNHDTVYGADTGDVQGFVISGGFWTTGVTIYAPVLNTGDRFGISLDFSGMRITIGASGNGGAVYPYLFERSGGSWSQTARLTSTVDAKENGRFGAALSIDPDGQSILVGAPRELGTSDYTGAAYVFDVPAGPGGPIGSYAPCPCGNDSEPGDGEGCANSTGLGGALLTATGSTSVSADDLAFHAAQVLPNQAALLISGVNALGGAHFGDGLRLVGGNLVRLEVAFPDAQGEADFGPGLASRGGWQAGDVRYLQVWYRDPVGSPCGSDFNLSNGLQVTFEQ